MAAVLYEAKDLAVEHGLFNGLYEFYGSLEKIAAYAPVGEERRQAMEEMRSQRGRVVEIQNRTSRSPEILKRTEAMLNRFDGLMKALT